MQNGRAGQSRGYLGRALRSPGEGGRHRAAAGGEEGGAGRKENIPLTCSVWGSSRHRGSVPISGASWHPLLLWDPHPKAAPPRSGTRRRKCPDHQEVPTAVPPAPLRALSSCCFPRLGGVTGELEIVTLATSELHFLEVICLGGFLLQRKWLLSEAPHEQFCKWLLVSFCLETVLPCRMSHSLTGFPLPTGFYRSSFLFLEGPLSLQQQRDAGGAGGTGMLAVLAVLVRQLGACQNQLPFWEELQDHCQNIPQAQKSTSEPRIPIFVISVEAHTVQGKDSNQLLAGRLSALRAHTNPLDDAMKAIGDQI
ncbi:uncharacterized protein LOC116445370 [Corvus moneduloides]|uniref:uncharacterized protein LOC116445370 n=1 Tax=Corvus moneduloides TaxID=1196302 RepID=UPI0013642599|nr:uncharacterized protein LOC116445370 [Corvus moneduloides]